MIQTLLKQTLRQNQDFGRLTNSLLICAERMLLIGTIQNYSPIKMDLSVPKAGNHLTVKHPHRGSLSIYSHFDSILNEDKLKCYHYKSFQPLSVF